MTDRKDDTVAQDRIPNLVRIGEIPSSYGQVLQTDIIDPATFTQSRCRFTMNRVAGFLHSDSKITLGVVPVTNARAFYPVNVGIASLIKSATLRIGSQTVCTTEDFGQFHAYQSLFISNEDNKEREQYLSQRLVNHGMVYDSGNPTTPVLLPELFSQDLTLVPLDTVSTRVAIPLLIVLMEPERLKYYLFRITTRRVLRPFPKLLFIQSIFQIYSVSLRRISCQLS